MSAFTLTGLLDGARRSVTWLGPGELQGDAGVIVVARAMAAGQTIAATPTSSGRPASLAEPWPAMVTLAEVFGGLGHVAAELEVEGDVPAWPASERARPGVVY